MRNARFVQSIVGVVPFLLAYGCAHGVDDASVISDIEEPPDDANSPSDLDAASAGGAGGSGGSSGAANGGGGQAAGAGGQVGGSGGADASDSGGARDGGASDVVADSAEVGPGDASVDAVCARETDTAFCSRLQKTCGSVTASDNCGMMTTATCGTCVTPATCGGGGVLNVCGAPVNLIGGGTVAASSPGVSPEDMTKAFDGNNATKWYAGNGVKTGWISYQFGAMASHTATSYTVTSGNDVPGRDPASWQFQGSNDGTAWVTVDTRTGQTFAARAQTNTYAVTGSAKYSRYRLNITAVNGGTDLQLAEIQISAIEERRTPVAIDAR